MRTDEASAIGENSISDAFTLRDPEGSSSDAPLGRIDHYELVRELGGGGFGTVYLARNTVSNIEVAVKGLPPLVRNNREELANIRSNFAIVSRLHHPNIAAALDLHPVAVADYADRRAKETLRVFSGDTMLVMQYAPGVALSEWRKQFPSGKVPFEKALTIVRQVAEALDYAHAQKIIHRDVKPSNVMIETCADGTIVARVLDFGLAAEIQSSMCRISQEVRDRSGTRPYMAPEQWQGQPQGPRTDLYSLAAMFYELVTGNVPFASVFSCGDPVVMMTAIATQKFIPSGDLPRSVRKALVIALAKDPSARYPSCAAFASALETGSSDRPAWVFAIMGVAVVGAGLWLWHQHPDQTTDPLPPPPMTNVVVRPPVPLPATNAIVRPLTPPAATNVVVRPPVPPAATNAVVRPPARPPVRPPAPPLTFREFAAVDVKGLPSGTRKCVKLTDRLAVDLIWCAPGKALTGESVGGFWLGKCEVSQALWTAVMNENPSRFPSESPEKTPVESVTRDDCLQFVDRLNALHGTRCFCLPTEMEWEYACRAGSTTAFFWGNDESPDKMYVGRRTGGPTCSGKYSANKWGFCDMHGNVAEWCDSRFSTGRGADGDAYVLRGGDWRSPAGEAGAAARMKCLTYNGTAVCGLRLCYSASAGAASKNAKTSLSTIARAPSPDKHLAKPTALPAPVETEKRPVTAKPGTLNRITIAAGVDLELVWCPPGKFLMGSPVTEVDRILGAEDQHELELSKGFWISKYEVTKLLWQEVMKDDSLGILDSERDPKDGVSWDDCTNFIARINCRMKKLRVCVRLPTEAEWEYACRAGSTSAFSFGDVLDGSQACCNGNDPYGTLERGKTWKFGPAKVGYYEKFANKWGINDMHGSLFEWCVDWYEPYAQKKCIDPKGPSSGDGRVVRGGCWRYPARQCRSAFRTRFDPTTRNDMIGFRLCCDQVE